MNSLPDAAAGAEVFGSTCGRREAIGLAAAYSRPRPEGCIRQCREKPPGERFLLLSRQAST